MPVGPDFADGVVVTDSSTVVDTDALVEAALQVRAQEGNALVLLSAVDAARVHVMMRTGLAPAQTAWAQEALERARASVAALAEGCRRLADALTAAALVYLAAESDADAFARSWGRLRPEEAGGWMVGFGSVHRRPHPLLALVTPVVWAVFGPSMLRPGLTWAQVAQIGHGQYTHFTDPDLSDGTEGLRLQMDLDAVAGILDAEVPMIGTGDGNIVGSEAVAWWGEYNAKAPEAASKAAVWAFGAGRVLNGPTTGVEVSTTGSDGRVSTTRVGSGVVAGGLSGPPLLPFPPGLVLGTVAGLPGLVPIPQVGDARRAGPGRAPTRTPTPTRPSELLGRIGDLDSTRNRGQVEILRHTTPDATGGSRTSWSVVIRGTQRWDAGGGNPQDFLTNLQGVAGEESDQTRAVKEAMAMAGIGGGEPVEFTGHSQGGIVAAQLAADPEVRDTYTVASVLTAGAPTAGSVPPAGVAMLNVENTADPVPALDGSANLDRGDAMTAFFDGRSVTPRSGEGTPVPHDLGVYTEAVAWMEGEGADRPEEVARWAERRRRALGLSGETTTTSSLFDTRRTGTWG